jgi:Ca-activated chloride channel family protein
MHWGLRALAPSVLVGLTLPGWTQVAPPRLPSFPTGVDLIRLSVSVTDGNSRYVGGLSEGDFAVFEDGIPQQLSFFTKEPLPLAIALLVDCSASMEENLPVARAAGVRFIRTLGREDSGQIVQFNDRMMVLQDFTPDQSALEAAIAKIQAAGSTALYDALYVTLKQLRRHGTREVPLRRAIILLSDGEDTASLATDEQVLELARQAEVGVYSIVLRRDRPQDRERLAFSQATYFLTALARDTGGQVYFTHAASELGSVYGRIAEELRTQYTLGYVSSNPRRDGRWRRIVVRTPVRGDLQVRHKAGYPAPRG